MYSKCKMTAHTMGIRRFALMVIIYIYCLKGESVNNKYFFFGRCYNTLLLLENENNENNASLQRILACAVSNIHQKMI